MDIAEKLEVIRKALPEEIRREEQKLSDMKTNIGRQEQKIKMLKEMKFQFVLPRTASPVKKQIVRRKRKVAAVVTVKDCNKWSNTKMTRDVKDIFVPAIDEYLVVPAEALATMAGRLPTHVTHITRAMVKVAPEISFTKVYDTGTKRARLVIYKKSVENLVNSMKKNGVDISKWKHFKDWKDTGSVPVSLSVWDSFASYLGIVEEDMRKILKSLTYHHKLNPDSIAGIISEDQWARVAWKIWSTKTLWEDALGIPHKNLTIKYSTKEIIYE